MRRLRSFALFILLGALATTVIAWAFAALGSAQFVNWARDSGGWHVAEDGQSLAWPVRVPESWPAPTLLVQTRGRGLAFDSGSAHAPAGGEPRRDDNSTFQLMSVRVGWPMYAFQQRVLTSTIDGETTELARTPAMDLPDWAQQFAELYARGVFARRMLPLVPIPLGFVANTTLFALGFWLALRLKPFVRAALRARRHQCVACGYPIGESPVCTECGAPVRGQPVVARDG